MSVGCLAVQLAKPWVVALMFVGHIVASSPFGH